LNQIFKIVRDGKKVGVTRSADAANFTPQSDLLAKVPVDEFVEVIYKDGVGTNGFLQPLEQAANDWAKAYADDQKIPPLPGAKCSSCEFKAASGDELQSGFHECWSQAYGFTAQDFAQGTVLDLWNFRKKDELILQGRIRLKNVQDGDINVIDGGETMSVSERQWMQSKGIPQEEDRVEIARLPTHIEIAARIGTHREAVTRELRQLTREGHVRQKGRQLEIASRVALIDLLSRLSR
jgi:hypothetical protein